MSLPETLEVTVTREHALKGIPQNPYFCAIALAVEERYGTEEVRWICVDPGSKELSFTENGRHFEYAMPKEAVAYAERFDTLIRMAEDGSERDDENDPELETDVPPDWPEFVTFTFTKREN